MSGAGTSASWTGHLHAWFAGLRPPARTGILSNSAPGAREAERPWGFLRIDERLELINEVIKPRYAALMA